MQNVIADIRQTLLPLYGKEEAAALTRIICQEMLGQTATDFFLGKDIVLSANQKTFLQSILERLQDFEPIQYIQQQAPFMGHRFFVAPGVLIPRPETEELVEHLTKILPADANIFDIGTGSGCIAISLALALPKAKVSACDISEQALTIAKYNNETHQAQVSFFQTDILTYQPETSALQSFDAIVSNPPYITKAEANTMEPKVLRYEPHVALFVDGNDPLLFYRKIAALGKAILKPDGLLAFEINRAYGQEVKEVLHEQGYQQVKLKQDLFGNNRFVFGRLKIDY